MFASTLERLVCPAYGSPRGARCGGRLSAGPKLEKARGGDWLQGQLRCAKCGASYPILGGVAVLVAEPEAYLLEHVKGVAAAVPEPGWPRGLKAALRAAASELETGHIEDDLEATRVVSLYLMNHFLTVKEHAGFWQPGEGAGSPLIDELVRRYWDEGPLARIAERVRREALGRGGAVAAVELGCGVGGLAPRIRAHARAYLGVDSSFASIALARHLVLGAPYGSELRIPEDLLRGPVSRALPPVRAAEGMADGSVDFVVTDLEAGALARGGWDVSVALNLIDMLEEPARLPELQRALLAPGGLAVQSCPYIWHERVAAGLRARLPREVSDSARAAEWLYEQAGFGIEAREPHVPWLFFKHCRQLELYSVHVFGARAAQAQAAKTRATEARARRSARRPPGSA